jgi:hypothetical protein
LDALDRLSRLDQAGLNATSTGVGIQMQMQNLAIAKANLANSTKSLQLALEDRQFRLDERKQSKEELEGFANYVKSGAAVLGFKDVVTYPTNKIIQLINTKDPTVMSLLNTGIQTQLAGQPVIAESAGVAARNIVQVGAPLRDDQKVMKSFFTDVWNKAASPEGGVAGRYDNTKLDQVTKAANSYAISAAQAQKNDIKFGDNTNIYSAPPLPAVLGTPAIQNSEFYKKVFAAHMAAGGLQEFNPEQITSMTLQAIKSGTIDYNTGAEGLQSIFNAAKLINNSTKNYAGFGLPFQDSYRTKMLDGGGASRTYDLTKSQDINQLLNSRLTSFRKGILDPFANRGQ